MVSHTKCEAWAVKHVCVCEHLHTCTLVLWNMRVNIYTRCETCVWTYTHFHTQSHPIFCTWKTSSVVMVGMYPQMQHTHVCVYMYASLYPHEATQWSSLCVWSLCACLLACACEMIAWQMDMKHCMNMDKIQQHVRSRRHDGHDDDGSQPDAPCMLNHDTYQVPNKTAKGGNYSKSIHGYSCFRHSVNDKQSRVSQEKNRAPRESGGE
jgi:hypothetical protein